MDVLYIVMTWSLVGAASIVIGDYIESKSQLLTRRMLAQDIGWGLLFGWLIPAIMFVCWIMDQKWWNEPAFKNANQQRTALRR
jgi:hypothetical protein